MPLVTSQRREFQNSLFAHTYKTEGMDGLFTFVGSSLTSYKHIIMELQEFCGVNMGPLVRIQATSGMLCMLGFFNSQESCVFF